MVDGVKGLRGTPRLRRGLIFYFSRQEVPISGASPTRRQLHVFFFFLTMMSITVARLKTTIIMRGDFNETKQKSNCYADLCYCSDAEKPWIGST